MKKRALCLLLSLCLILGVCPAASAQGGRLPFKDVPAGSWFEDYVAYVYENGLMNGTGAAAFSPGKSLSRGMFVTVLGRLDGVDPAAYTGSSFSDVKPAAYYAPYVEWAAAMKLVNGTGGGKYSPDSTITREQMAAIIARYARSANLYLPESDSPAGYFEDADQVSAYAREGLELMRVTGLLQGSNGRFSPRDTATRAQASAIFMRLNQAAAVDPERCGGPVVSGSRGSAGEEYSITGLSIQNGKIAATVCTGQPCVLVAEIQSVDGAALSSTAVRVAGGLGMEPVSLRITGDLPEHFQIAAVLRDENGNNLSNTFVDRKYTKEHQEFMALTPESPRFKGQNVVDFDGSDANNATQTENFGVLAQGVRQVDAASLTLAADGLSCTYTGGEAPRPGEVLYIVGANGESTVVKVGSAEASGGSVTVRAAESSNLSDYYQMLKVHLGGAGGVEAQSDGDHLIDVDPMDPLHMVLGAEFTLGPVAPHLEGDYTAELEIHYDPALLGENYFYFRIEEITTWTAGVYTSVGVSDDDFPAGMLEKDLCEPTTFHTNVPGLNVQLQALGFVEFSFDTGVDLSADSVQKKAFIHETGQPDQTGRSKDGTVRVNAENQFQAGFGGRLRLSAGIGLGSAENALSGGINGEVKIEVEGKEAGKLYEDSIDDSQRHDCERCIEGALNLAASCYLDLRYHLTDLLSGDLAEVKLIEGVFKLTDFYCAKQYDPAYNVFDRDGAAKSGLGKCPNVRYKQTVNTVDVKGRAVSGVPVAIRDKKTGRAFSGASPYEEYLLKGAHDFTADFDAGKASKSQYVQGGGGSVTLEEPSATLYGTVEDTKGKGISGARVTVKQNGETVASMTTNGKGGFTIEKIPAGSYTVEASANGYNGSGPVSVTLSGNSFKEVLLTLRSNRAVKVNYERKYNRNFTEYAVLTGIDENGKTCWTYTTPTYPSTQFFSSYGMGIHNDQYYLYLAGSITALDLADGSVLWSNADFGGMLDSEKYVFDSGTGDLFVSGEFGPELFWVSPQGKTLARIKGDGVWGKPALSNGVVTTHGWSSTAAAPDTKEYINRYALSAIRGKIQK